VQRERREVRFFLICFLLVFSKRQREREASHAKNAVGERGGYSREAPEPCLWRRKIAAARAVSARIHGGQRGFRSRMSY
jgi:hypothetical protein